MVGVSPADPNEQVDADGGEEHLGVDLLLDVIHDLTATVHGIVLAVSLVRGVRRER